MQGETRSVNDVRIIKINSINLHSKVNTTASIYYTKRNPDYALLRFGEPDVPEVRIDVLTIL